MNKCITCPVCGWTSWHPSDFDHRYCGHCHLFHDHMDPETIHRATRKRMRFATYATTRRGRFLLTILGLNPEEHQP